MKKTRYFLVLFAALIMMSACEKLLEVKPEDLTGVEEGLQTSSDLKAVLIGTYDIFRNSAIMGGTAKVAADVLAEEAYASSTGFEWGQIKTLNMNLFNPVGRDIWAQSYLCINRANVVIDYLDNDKIVVTANEKKEWKAEAQFIRAICYYHLLQYFSLPYDETKTNNQPGVPMRLAAVLANESANTRIQRSSVEDVYAFVIEELLDAELNLPAQPAGNGRATIDAASGFLAKVYFQMNNMPKAYEYSNKVISTQKYLLDNSWQSKFAAANFDSVTHEVVYSLYSSAISDNSGSGLTGAYRTNLNDPPGFGPSDKLAANLKEVNTDKRAVQLVDKAGANNIPGVYSNKYNYEYMHAPMINLNEMLLIRAESGLLSSQGDPAADLHAIQTRANVPNTAATLENIRSERRKELALEGYHFFDLKRIRSMNIHGEGWNSSKLIFQIPDQEQNGNPDIILN